MIIIVRDGRQFGYKYTCSKCTTQYVATHDEEHRTTGGAERIYTYCPICGKMAWANTSEDIDCSEVIELKKRLEKIENGA